MKKQKLPLFDNLLSLLYPQVCAACGTLLYSHEETVCLSCRVLLPKTGYEKEESNPVSRVFWGRIPFNAVSACYFFSKQGKIQHLIHELKYKKNTDAGLFLGKEIAKELIQSPLYQNIDCIVPVPLHPKKIRIRGYNQSEIIGKGMAEVIQSRLNTNNLLRTAASTSQTKKSRFARWENVKDIFVLNQPEEFAGKHILLVDDVITTGSTIEACGRALMQSPGIKVSVAAAACAVS
ncbi:MAG: ComF family protein [Bacteroidales bacterium]|nr:ComF family protein [Bacteroidales bacterium]